MPPQHTHGLLVLDKPGGMTSREALDRALSWFPRGTRAGHTGTLDPLATGVLVLCLGSATRLAEYVQDMGKTYRAGVRLGARSDTDDADGAVMPVAGAAAPDRAALEAALRGFLGEIEQVPPAFSAAKVAGRRAYDLARRGQDVALEARRVRVHGIDVLAYDYPRLEVEVRCGKGTYIRSLARDLGERLGCGGYVETLRRTSGRTVHRGGGGVARRRGRGGAVKSDAGVRRGQRPAARVVDDAVAVRLRLGQGVPADEATPETGAVAVFDARGALVAVARFDQSRRLLRPEKVFAPE